MEPAGPARGERRLAAILAADLAFEDMGEQALKNMVRPVRVYRVRAALTHPVPTEQVRGQKAHDAPGSPLSRIGIAGEGAEGHSPEAGEGSLFPALPLPDKPS